jgi:ABC-2 type transport system ATP-binding protein
MDLFGIRDRADELCAQLSKGLKQRVALTRTLLHKPNIILLDEPTSGLDPASAREFRDLVVRLQDQKHSVLLSTHNLDEVERVATRVAVLRTRLIAVDTPAALHARLFGSRLRVELGQDATLFRAAATGPGVSAIEATDHRLSIAVDDAGDRAPAIVRRLVAAGADIRSVVAEERSLEDVYLKLLSEAAS